MAKKKSANPALKKTLDACVEQGNKLLARVKSLEQTVQDRDSTINCQRQLIAENEKALKAIQAELTAKDQEIELLQGKVGQPVRRHLDDTRRGVTHKFTVGGHEGYMTVGFFSDGAPGELFITMAKEGSTIGGLMDTIGKLTSVALQYGVTIETLARKFAHQRFEPSGYTSNPELNQASSIIDYVFRWLELHFVKARQAETPAKA